MTVSATTITRYAASLLALSGTLPPQEADGDDQRQHQAPEGERTQVPVLVAAHSRPRRRGSNPSHARSSIERR